ncbi:hydantoinase/oxoprolinase N-terminal domain-containing protein [Pseudonocardia benzenivorans]|uniref:Hydantoinase/oxoprolinase n=2 Tax=Pseudonocardia TaxID=1847 RepID=F4CSY3_PSEUX|nr:hydantoinase/oxoprolinase family protein [Pseudonocardia dioxanivorans]AEA25282.1 Hydantoinase/oxoprolinase [Pseudonocardia dioxanivorans CB1190]
MSELRIGIDVGGTNTDAVVVDEAGTILAAEKLPTTAAVFEGIRAALDAVLGQVDPGAVGQVMLGTTHPVNAIIGRTGLGRVGVLRVAAPATTSVPPFAGWPEDLTAQVRGPVAIVRGGHGYDGAPAAALDEDAVRLFAKDCAGTVDAIAVTAMSSPVNDEHERRAAEIVADVLAGTVAVTESREVGGIGLLERENSAILNSALVGIGRTVAEGLITALGERGLSPDLFLTQNDGTLLTVEEALRRPVLTIGSGPTNSMRGAAYLSGLTDAVVMDVGGTSTDVGLLVGGFPRESALAVEIGGVRTNYRMPDLIAVGLGGGTVVDVSGAGAPVIGPRSVAHRLTSEALVFGGTVLTLSDVSTAAGRSAIGDPALARVDPPAVHRVLASVDRQIAALADRIKASRGTQPLIAVGGGAHLVPEHIEGISAVHRHEHGGVANAIGAAIAEASGSVDRTFAYADGGREACLDEARRLAVEQAVRAGADPARVRITMITEVPMSYMPGNSVRVQAKAAGPLLARR